MTGLVHDVGGDPGSGSVAEPGLVGVAPGSGVIMSPPISVCHQVSTIGLGWPFEWPAIVLMATGLGYDMVWFGTIAAVVLQTAFLSPPVAMSAYYLKQAVREWSLGTIYRGMYEFMVIQCLCVRLVLAFPQIAMWFPEWLQEDDRMATPALPGDESHDNRRSLEAGDALTNDPEDGEK
jgi:Tripartite ATP-independent periplasmic transporter, DctM component